MNKKHEIRVNFICNFSLETKNAHTQMIITVSAMQTQLVYKFTAQG